jgi:hypothetical protein
MLQCIGLTLAQSQTFRTCSTDQLQAKCTPITDRDNSLLQHTASSAAFARLVSTWPFQHFGFQHLEVPRYHTSVPHQHITSTPTRIDTTMPQHITVVAVVVVPQWTVVTVVSGECRQWRRGQW